MRGDARPSVPTRRCQQSPSLKVNLWIFNFTADEHKGMKRRPREGGLTPGRAGPGSEPAIVMQNVQRWVISDRDQELRN